MDLNDAQLETIERIRTNSGSPAGEHDASEHDDGALVRFANGSGYVLDADGDVVGFADEAAAETEDETEIETENDEDGTEDENDGTEDEATGDTEETEE